MATHTPGPWAFQDAMIVSTTGTGIARVLLNLKQREVNGPLLAAPDMLKTLEQIAYSDFSADVARQKARAAIAKAEGK